MCVRRTASRKGAGLTQDAHDVFAVDLPLGVHLRALLAQDLLPVFPEKVVQVPQARERVRGEVPDQPEERHRDVVPRRAEEYGGVRGLIFDVLSARIFGLAFSGAHYFTYKRLS